MSFSSTWVNPAFTLLTGYAAEEVLDGVVATLGKGGRRDEHQQQGAWIARDVVELFAGDSEQALAGHYFFSSPCIISGILPASHYVALARGVFLKGLPLTEFASPIVTLLVIGVTTLAASLAIFKKRIS